MMTSILVTFRLGARDLIGHRRLALIMGLSIAISVGMYALLATYRAGLALEFSEQKHGLLVVHDDQNVGDITGSRISNQVAKLLAAKGIRTIIPEIDTLTGTSLQDVTLLRGIDLEHYMQLETFSILSGRRLVPGDPPRLAMVGELLAARQQLKPGDTIKLRGRNFTVVGVFQNGTYMDNQAWISLADAQALLGWGQDVSVDIIPDEGILHEGDSLPGGLSVSRKGESLQLVAAQYQPVLDIWQIVSLALGIAATLALINILWRLAWLHRRDLAILRTTGFPAVSLGGYLLIQAAGITLTGILLGGLLTLCITFGVHLTVSSLTITPRVDVGTLLPSVGWAGLLMLGGSLLPAWWLSHLNLANLLRAE
jgi:ABC-type antimicrobial peptide transport system permease subunit